MRSTQRRIFHRSAFLALWLVGVASCGSSTRDVGDTSTTAPIVITLDEPHDLSTVRTSKLVVRGTISGVTGGEVLVNETPLEIVDGRFDGTVTLREGKDVTLTVLHAPSGTRLVRTLYVDYTPPKLAINAPERATRRTPPDDQLTVSLEVSDNLELTRLEYEGVQIPVPANGKVEHSVTLTTGLNTLVFIATDGAGNRSSRRVNVLYGETKSPSDVLDSAIRLNVGPVALSVIAEVGQQIFDGLDLQALLLAANPLYTSSIVTVNLQTISHTTPSTLLITPKTGLLDVQFALKGLSVVLGAQLDTLVTVTVSADAINVAAQVKPTLEGGVPQTTIENLAVSFSNLSVSVDDSDLVNAWPEYKQTIETEIGTVVTTLVQTYLFPLIDEWLPKVVDPRTFSVAGLDVELQPVPEVLNVSAEGIYLRLGAAVTILGAPPGIESPGYLYTPGDWTAVTTSEHLKVVVRDDLINLVLHEVWRAGLLRYTIDQESLDAQKSEVELVAGFLGSIVDDLQPPLNPETPITISLEAPLPPVISFSDDPARMLELGLGDFRATIATAGVDARTLLVGHVTVQMKTGLGFVNEAVVPEGLLVGVGVDLDATARTSVAAFENFTNLLLQPIGENLGALVQPVTLPQFSYVRYSDPAVEIVGPNKHHLSVELRLHPAVTP